MVGTRVLLRAASDNTPFFTARVCPRFAWVYRERSNHLTASALPALLATLEQFVSASITATTPTEEDVIAHGYQVIRQFTSLTNDYLRRIPVRATPGLESAILAETTSALDEWLHDIAQNNKARADIEELRRQREAFLAGMPLAYRHLAMIEIPGCPLPEDEIATLTTQAAAERARRISRRVGALRQSLILVGLLSQSQTDLGAAVAYAAAAYAPLSERLAHFARLELEPRRPKAATRRSVAQSLPLDLEPNAAIVSADAATMNASALEGVHK
jgi:hypothetical protein